MPTLSIYPLFGMKYGMDVFCSTVVVVATLLSFVTISLNLGLVQLFILTP